MTGEEVTTRIAVLDSYILNKVDSLYEHMNRNGFDSKASFILGEIIAFTSEKKELKNLNEENKND